MSELTIICLGIQSIEEIPEDKIKLLQESASVNLHCNKLKNLNGLKSVISITSLNLSSNEFQSVNLPELCLLPNLVTLDLAGNLIENLYDFPFMPSIKNLSLAYNVISSLEGIENCPSLITLDVRSNVLNDINDIISLSQLNELEVLNISNGDSNKKNSNLVYTKYSKNINSLNFLSRLKILDGLDINLWPKYDEVYHIPTPKFDLLVKKFRPGASSISNPYEMNDNHQLSNKSKNDLLDNDNSEKMGASTDLQVDQKNHIFVPNSPAKTHLSDTKNEENENSFPSAKSMVDKDTSIDLNVSTHTEKPSLMSTQLFIRQLINSIKSIQKQTLHRCFFKLYVNTLKKLPIEEEVYGNITQTISNQHAQNNPLLKIDSSSQSDIPSKESFPEIYKSIYDELEDQFSIQEKLRTKSYLEIELKLKNDLAFKTQMVDAIEKRRVNNVINLSAEIEALKSTNDQLNSTIDAKNKEIEELKLLLENKNVNINEEIKSHETDKSEHIVQIKFLQEKLDAEVKLNESHLELMKSAELKFTDEITRLTHENKSLSFHIESNKIRESEERKCLEDQVCELINLLKDKSNELDRVAKSRDTTLASFVENEKVVESWKSKFYQVNERYEEMKLDSSQKIAYLEDKLESQRLSMFELREVTKELKMAKDDLTNRYRDLEVKFHASRESEEATKIKANKQNQILHEKLSQLEKDFSNLSIVNGKISVNPQRLSDLEKKILDSESNLKIKSTMLDDQNELIKILREKNIDLDSKIKANLSQLNTLQSEIKDLKKYNKDLESKLGHKKKLEVELRSLIKELSRDLYEDLGINRIGGNSRTRNKDGLNNNIEENDYGISSDEEGEKDEEDEEQDGYDDNDDDGDDGGDSTGSNEDFYEFEENIDLFEN